jgi:hypothetical protein
MNNLFYRIFQSIGLIIISLGLLFGGVAILRTQIPFWSLVYGLPAVSLGICITMISFNEIIKNRTVKGSEYHLIACKVCQKQTLAPFLIETVVCPDCQYRTAIKLQVGALVFLLAIAIPITLHLVKESQNIYQNAQINPSPGYFCEKGNWEPSNCRCGTWNKEIICVNNGQGRSCNNANYCCYKNESSWNCLQNKP